MKAAHFDGETYDASKDQVRLGTQMQRVFDVLQDGKWHTLPEISERTAAPEASVSARIRDLRKERFGSHKVKRKRVADAGLWKYKLKLPKKGKK